MKHRLFKNLKLPETYWGFPVADASVDSGSDENQELQDKNGNPKPNQGIALLLAIMMVAIVMGFMADMIVSASVSVELAQGSRDRIKAEYMAKAGLNLARFVTQIDWGIDMFMHSQSKKMPTDGIGDIWSAVNDMPIGGSTMKLMASMQESFDLSKLMDGEVMNQLALLDGQFTIKTTDESSKINVNFCHKGRCTQVLTMLQALFSCPVEKAFLDSKELDGKKLAFRIKDYIDDDKRGEQESGYSDENDPYQGLTPKYRAKNAPLDSLDELKMIDGWDDQVNAVFSPYLTVFPIQGSGRDVPQINFNTASKELLACLVPEGLKDDCKKKFMLTMAAQGEDKTTFSEDGDMRKAMSELLCYSSDGAPTDGDKAAGDKASWFVAASRIFRIEVQSEVGNQKKTLTAVIERLDAKDMKDRKTSKSYEMLYWKLM
jgi:general secretion pathway protein K